MGRFRRWLLLRYFTRVIPDPDGFDMEWLQIRDGWGSWKSVSIVDGDVEAAKRKLADWIFS